MKDDDVAVNLGPCPSFVQKLIPKVGGIVWGFTARVIPARFR
jgi:hypothetical protein